MDLWKGSKEREAKIEKYDSDSESNDSLFSNSDSESNKEITIKAYS
jgi:hypothetical protein